jgi:hypothetical protein
MGSPIRSPGQMYGLETESTVSDGLAVVVGSADHKVALPAGADPTGGVVGLVHRPDGTTATSGAVVDVVSTGIYPAVASAAISRGAKVAIAGTTGKVKTAAPAAGTNSMILGTALEAAAADGDRISVLLSISLMQG